MDHILKTARLEALTVDDKELELINRQTLRPMTAEEVFVFRLAACDNQVDRDNERFTDRTLSEFAALFPGRPVLRDHRWSSDAQTARIYGAEVETDGSTQRLVLRCYMPRTDTTASTIALIESGILREASVGVSVRQVICSVCGTDQVQACCQHAPGRTYDDQMCVMELDGAADVYEVSLVAVPAQPEAGIVKSKRYGGAEESSGFQEHIDPWQDEALLELEKNRF